MTGEVTIADVNAEHLALVEALPERPTCIGIIDAGSQLLKPIDRRIREIGADTIIFKSDVTAEELVEKCDAFVISGGGDSVYQEDAPRLDSRIFNEEFPLPGFAICFGFQAMNQSLGGTVEPGEKGRYGQCDIDITEDNSPLFTTFDGSTKVLMNAGDCVTADNLAPGLVPLAFSREGSHETVAAFRNQSGTKIGVQFHPEVDLTERGDDLFRNFIQGIAGLELNYTQEAKKEMVSQRIRTTVGHEPVVTGVSGGVDSTVLAAAIHVEVGDRQHVIHMDTGFNRKGESALVMTALRNQGLPENNIHFIDATLDFRYGTTTYNGRQTRTLMCESDPETKRHIFGAVYTRVLENAFRELGLNPETALLGQGTLRPDLIESAGVGSKGKKIKTHHNDTPLLRAWRESGRLVEPLSDLHKDEVRQLGLELGLPEEVIWRQPFPGPGLLVRIVGGREADDFEGHEAVEDSLRQFADTDTSVHLLPVRTVGVQGDDRTYKHVAALSTNGEPNWDRYMEYAAEIPKAYRDISRVIFISGEQIDQNRSLFDTVIPTFPTQSNVELLQEADDLVNQSIRQYGLLEKLAQQPGILTKVQIDKTKEEGRLFVVRPVVTNDFMVASAAKPGSDKLPLLALKDQFEAALSVRGIGRVGIDLTGKPPGTIEWE